MSSEIEDSQTSKFNLLAENLQRVQLWITGSILQTHMIMPL